MASLPVLRAHPLRDQFVPDGEGMLTLPTPEYVTVTMTRRQAWGAIPALEAAFKRQDDAEHKRGGKKA